MNNRGVCTDKEILEQKVKQVAKNCQNLEELKTALENNGIETYDRKGVLTGAHLGKRRFRLTTLGLTKQHLKTLTLEQMRLNELRNKGNENEKNIER